MSDLYERCELCDGKLTTKAVMMVDDLDGYSGPLAPGSNCPCTRSSTPGWSPVGLNLRQVDSLRARVAELEAALRPFVEWWDAPDFVLTSKASMRLRDMIKDAREALTVESVDCVGIDTDPDTNVPQQERDRG